MLLARRRIAAGQIDLFSEVYYDVETQLSANDVGGWENIHLMRVSLAVSWSHLDGFREWDEAAMPKFISYLNSFQRVYSFNGDRFDAQVLSRYGDVAELRRRSVDVFVDASRKLGHRISLDSLAQATLGAGKTADGMQALRWWKEGRLDLIAMYCRQDVQVLVDLVRFARANGYVRFLDKQGATRSLGVHW